MGEEKTRGRYYTRSRRSPEDGRVLREYVKSGPLAKIVAEEDRTGASSSRAQARGDRAEEG